MLMALFSWVAPPDAQCHRDVLAGSEAVEEHRAGSAVATDGTWLFVGAPGWDVLDPTIIGKVYVYTWTGTDWVETQVLDNNGPRFGKSLSLDGNRLAVGAKDEVYVFEESGGVWSQHARLSPTGAKQGFGTSVAIHGDWLAVGAPESSTELFVPNNDGAGYIFHWDGSSWVQEAMVEAPVPADVGFDATHEDRFGHGVAIGTDGFGGVFALFGTPDDAVEGIASIGFNTIFVAGVGNVDISENEAAPGAAYVYERINNSWQLETTLQPSGSRDADHFGWDLASRNNLVVIGAPGDSVVGTNGGSAWVFQRTPDRNWTELETLLPFDGGGTGTSFGTDVAISANEIVIGALWPYGDSGLAFAFEKQGTSRWDPFGKIVAPVEDEAFGISVAVGPLLAVVGAPKRDESLSSDGVAYTFELGCTDCDGNGVDDVMEPDADGDGTTDACDLCPTGPDYLDGDQDGFANACDACEGFHDALDADLDGVPDSCDADRCAGQWIGTPSLSGGDSFGAAMDLDFETLVVGSPGAVGTNDFEGAVHVLVLDDAGTPWIGDDTWPLQATLTMPSPESGSRFGSALAVSGDRVVAGAPDANAFDGRALTWDRSGTFWGSPVELDPAGCTSPTTAGAQYGYSVAAAGSISVVSSPGDGGFGGVRVFDGATCIATLIASDAEPDDNFGSSVAVSGNGDWILIGANYRSTVADADGSVYVFRRTGPSSWVEHDRIEASNGRDYANFGQSVAIDDDGMRAVVGAPLGDSAVQRSGAAYALVREENGTHGLIDDDIWYEEQRLPVIGAGGGAYFGSSVDIGPGAIAVGLPYPQFGGAVHVFTQIQGTWYRSLGFGQPSDPRVNRYGDTVALGTDWIFGGAPYSSPIGLLSGVVLGVPLMAYYDTDGDFTPDTCDICPAGDDGFDADADGTPDACDICPAGDDGSDTDADGVADACDACPGYDDFEDFDADGYADGCDACLYGDDDADADGDGAADACDKCPGEDDTVDGNGNGVPDGCETVAFEEIRANDATAEDHFGKSVAVDGINAVIGAPEADLFDSVFGLPGSAYVFRLEGPAWTRWVQKQKLTASDAAPDHAFGQSVAIDGNAILVGAPLAPNGVADPSGAAYLFRDAGAGFAEEAKLIASDATTSWLVGWDVALDGDLAVAGAPWADIATTSSDAPGAAYVFRHAGGGLWNQEIKLSASSPTGGDWYGASVAVRGDVVAVGASQRFTGQGDDGRVFVYRFNGSSWIEEDVLTASDAAANDRFGTAVVLGDDILVVGADGAAKAYLYVYDGVDWNEVQVLTAPEPSVLFGARVALDDKRLLISGLDGKVFLFRYDSVLQQAEPVTTIASQDLVNGDNYGFAADVSGDAILVGAHQHAHPGTAGGGSVYAAIPGDAADCDGNGVPDVLEVSGTVYDCDGDLVLDVCSVTPLADSDGDGVSDGCDIAPGQDDDPDGDGLAGPIIVDPEWTLVESVIHRSPVGGHFSPLDDKLYFGQRYGSPVGLYRIEPSGEVTALHTGLGPAGLVIDQDGDVYMSTDGTGAIYRHAYNSWTRQTWVTGFHSGDDDPQGMAIAPDGYTGSVVSPGEGLIMDHGFNGPDEIWR
ncbi:MAG: hypothetical protein ACYSUU_03975, partial [Planctomycetota bacterium]